MTAETLARAAIDNDPLLVRSLAQDLVQHYPLASIPRPMTDDLLLLGTAAALIELLALRSGQSAPDWTRDIGPVPQPTFLVAAASRMDHLRHLCETESPEPLRRRDLFATPDYLSFA